MCSNCFTRATFRVTTEKTQWRHVNHKWFLHGYYEFIFSTFVHTIMWSFENKEIANENESIKLITHQKNLVTFGNN